MPGVYLYGPRDLRLVEPPPDQCGPTEVRIAVSYSGICGTDLHLYGGMIFGAVMSQPRPLGHEYAGHIVEVGAAVSGARAGQRVTAMPSGPCGLCLLCRTGRPSVCRHRVRARTGAWAPTIVVPAALVFPLPDAVSDRLAALTEPLACAIRAVDRAGLRSADRVCIIGAGPIGLLVLKVAQVSGASMIVVAEPNPYRRALAERLGADHVVDPTGQPLAEVVGELTDELGADLVFEAVGLPATIEQAVAVAAPGGRVVIVGVTDRDAEARFRPQEVFWKELTIIGARESTHGADRALRWLSRLELEPLITHTFPLAEVQAAVDLGLTGQAGKILLQP